MCIDTMHTHLICAGKSQGIVLPKKLLQKYRLNSEMELHATSKSLLIKPIASPAWQGWEAQMQAALAAKQELEGELLEGLSDDAFEDAEWQW